MADASELPIETGADAFTIAEQMFGSGIKIVDASYQGDPASVGLYSEADKYAPGVAPADSGVILSTGRAESFTNSSGATNQSSSTSTDVQGVDGDPLLSEIANAKTFDGAIFTAKFVPLGGTLTMQVTFSSEEYMEYAGSGFNDAVGIWVNGEKAQLTVGDGDVSINNINAWSNQQLYVDNADGALNTEMDGLTITLTLKAKVNPGEINDIRIGIADGGDAVYDSNLLIAANSIQTEVVAQDDTFTLDRPGKVNLNLIENDQDATKTGLFITKINGIPVGPGSVVLLPDGTEITVNGDGTITLVAHGEEQAGEHTFSYEVTNGNGITDVGFVHGTIACFVAGSRIVTAEGQIAVEALRPGDLVLTLDHGLQELRWVGSRQVPSEGRFAAVLIPAGTFGEHGALRVSPMHRLLLGGWQAELYCGEPEVLVKAAHLVRAGLLRQDHSGRPVTYFHLLFDRHEIICAEGLWSESYMPSAIDAADPATRQEFEALFPEGTRPRFDAIARTEASRATAVMLGAAWT